MYMIMFVLNDAKKLDLILDGWNNIGIRGVTIFETTGAYRRRMRIPGRYAFTTTNEDEKSQTLMAIVNDESIAKKCLNTTEKLIGDLSNPNTGVFTYWPLTAAKGIEKQYNK